MTDWTHDADHHEWVLDKDACVVAALQGGGGDRVTCEFLIYSRDHALEAAQRAMCVRFPTMTEQRMVCELARRADATLSAERKPMLRYLGGAVVALAVALSLAAVVGVLHWVWSLLSGGGVR